MLADSVGLALLVVLDSLNPDERLAFVLHDLFAVPFDEIAEILGRSPAAARQVASRARRRVQGSAPRPAATCPANARWYGPFSPPPRAATSTRCWPYSTPMSCCAPTLARLRAGRGLVRGARLVAEQASLYRRNAPASLAVREVTVNGGPGLLSSLDGKPVALLGFTIASGQVVELDIIADTERLVRLGVTALID